MMTNDRAAEIADKIIDRVGPDIRLALPLGLGKPITLLNALTGMVARRPEVHLSIFTALTLERPAPSDLLGKRLLEPALDRLFGAYPQVDYATWLREHRMPPNIEVHEFFLLAGRWLGIEDVQTRYVSANYTHALDVLTGARPNLVLQLVAPMENGFSLSCNPDITCDLLDMRRAGALDFTLAVETNAELPPMGGSSLIETDEADLVLEPDKPFELFSAVRQPVGDVEHAIGLHVSRLVRDGGTLQLGIGSLGDAVAHALLLRDTRELSDIWQSCPFTLGERFRETAPFGIGLYAVTEMLVEGILRLYEAGVIRRKVGGAAIHAAFFVETRDFYRRLREMPTDQRSGIAMEPVTFTNALYGEEHDKRIARTGARFVNAAMKATLLGAVASDATEDGQVVSGVGGQFNFVEQAFALKDARSVLILPASRTRRGRAESNIVWTYGHTTVPRHMRDIVVTEYGIADLRGKSDAEVIAAMVEIADSRFQEELLAKARSAGKVRADYAIPERARTNTPDRLKYWLGPYRDGKLPEFPFGTDFTGTEQRLLSALVRLKEARGSLRALLPYAVAGVRRASGTETELLERMGLSRTSGIGEFASAVLLRGALRRCRR